MLNDDGRSTLFSGPYVNTRDPMVLKIGSAFYCYYMGHNKDAALKSAVFCRTSADLRQWSEPVMVAAGGIAATQSDWYGCDCDRCRIGTLPVAAPEIIEHEGEYYIAALLPLLKGIRLAKLEFG